MKLDLFGRTEEQLVADIERGERVYRISSAYTGGEGLGLALAAKRKNLDVDRRCLAQLRSGHESDELRPLAGDALKKWRADIVRMGQAGR